MELLFRALNDYDIACNPLINGLASKKLIYDMTMSYLLENERLFMDSLRDKEKDEYCKQNMIRYINTHQHKLKRMIDKRGSEITRNLSRIGECDLDSWTCLLYYLSSLNTHLYNGSKINTDWISTSKNINSLSKYWENQNTHKVAVLATNSNGLIDNNTVVVDLSSKEIIKDILFMLNKKVSEKSVKEIIERVKKSSISFVDIFDKDIFVMTNEKFVGFNYAVSDSEVCIYRFYPSKNVISVLEQLQLDLIAYEKFNLNYILLDKEQQVLELNRLKDILKRIIIKENDAYLFHVFEEIYLKNNNIELVQENVFDRKRINHNRIKILKLAKNINNIQIKR